MNDITALMATMKAAAEKATPGSWRAFQYHDGRCGVGGGHDAEIMVCEHISKERPHDAEFIAAANPANVLALVEALEKARRANAAQDDHINQQQDRIDQLEKGHREAAKQINSWRRLAKQNIDEREKDISELEASRQRIAELESRTVTVKLPTRIDNIDLRSPLEVEDMWIYRLKNALAAAGIQVNGLWVNRDSKPFQANKQAECDYMFSALRRMDLRGHLKEVYDGVIVNKPEGNAA